MPGWFEPWAIARGAPSFVTLDSLNQAAKAGSVPIAILLKTSITSRLMGLACSFALDMNPIMPPYWARIHLRNPLKTFFIPGGMVFCPA